SEDLDNSESIYTNSPKSDSEGSNYITDDGFVIKDDINTLYIQHGFVKNDSVFFFDNELMMDDSSFSSQSLQFKKKEIVETIKTKLTQHNRKRKCISKEEKEEKEEVNGVNLESNGVNEVSSTSSPA
ncbi:22339_t:CDS:2, partial [Racocetra persica]